MIDAIPNVRSKTSALSRVHMEQSAISRCEITNETSQRDAVALWLEKVIKSNSSAVDLKEADRFFVVQYEERSNATTQVELPRSLDKEMKLLLSLGRNEFFQDGMDSNFSTELLSFISENGEAAIDALGDAVNAQVATVEVISEALRWIGRIQHPVTYIKRKWLLVRSLNHQSSRVRDGAILGLAAMNDPSTIRYIRHAIHREPIAELRQDMQQILMQLEKTKTEQHERAITDEGS